MKLIFKWVVLVCVCVSLCPPYSGLYAAGNDMLAPPTEMRSGQLRKEAAVKSEEKKVIRELAKTLCADMLAATSAVTPEDEKRVRRMMELFLQMGPYTLDEVRKNVDLAHAYRTFKVVEKNRRGEEDYSPREINDLWDLYHFLVLAGFDMSVIEAVFPKTVRILGFDSAYNGALGEALQKRNLRGGYYYPKPVPPDNLARDPYHKSGAFMAFLDLQEGDTYIDIMGGAGDEAIAIAKAFPKASVMMMDANARNIREALVKAEKLRLRNLRFFIGDVRTADDGALFRKGTVKAITINGWAFYAYSHPEIKSVFEKTLRLLKPGGRIFFDTRDRREVPDLYRAALAEQVYVRHSLDLERSRDKERYPLTWFGAEVIPFSSVSSDDLRRLFLKMQTFIWFTEGLSSKYAGIFEFIRVMITEKQTANDLYRIIHLPSRKQGWMKRKLKSIAPGQVRIIGSSGGEPRPSSTENYSDNIITDYRLDREGVRADFFKIALYFMQSIGQLERDMDRLLQFEKSLSAGDLPLSREDKRAMLAKMVGIENRKVRLLWHQWVLMSPEEAEEECVRRGLVPAQLMFSAQAADPVEARRLLMKLQTVQLISEGTGTYYAFLGMMRYNELIIDPKTNKEMGSLLSLPAFEFHEFLKRTSVLLGKDNFIMASGGVPIPNLKEYEFPDDLIRELSLDDEEKLASIRAMAGRIPEIIDRLQDNHTRMRAFAARVKKGEIALKDESGRDKMAADIEMACNEAQKMWESWGSKTPLEIEEQLIALGVIPRQKEYRPAERLKAILQETAAPGRRDVERPFPGNSSQ